MKRSIAVIGKGDAFQGSPDYEIAEKIGFTLIESGYRLITGGLKGVMEAASRGAQSASRHQEGDVVGILPGSDKKEGNPYLDLILPTGLGIARNMIVAASDAVIIIGGGAGTLSEAALAWQMRRLLLAWRGEGFGWSARLADKPLDSRERFPGLEEDRIFGFDTAGEAVSLLQKHLKDYL
ncbi:MAG TPA: TIGR00725 family protein [Candidatus Mcinerneyibacteriales bacterium]|nr:TIGR00725 family protein [Candidatus Mcinerneyibacteriales bacterium]